MKKLRTWGIATVKGDYICVAANNAIAAINACKGYGIDDVAEVKNCVEFGEIWVSE